MEMTGKKIAIIGGSVLAFGIFAWLALRTKPAMASVPQPMPLPNNNPSLPPTIRTASGSMVSTTTLPASQIYQPKWGNPIAITTPAEQAALDAARKHGFL